MDGHRHSSHCSHCEIVDIYRDLRMVVHEVEDIQLAVFHLNNIVSSQLEAHMVKIFELEEKSDLPK